MYCFRWNVLTLCDTYVCIRLFRMVISDDVQHKNEEFALVIQGKKTFTSYNVSSFTDGNFKEMVLGKWDYLQNKQHLVRLEKLLLLLFVNLHIQVQFNTRRKSDFHGRKSHACDDLHTGHTQQQSRRGKVYIFESINGCWNIV